LINETVTVGTADRFMAGGWLRTDILSVCFFFGRSIAWVYRQVLGAILVFDLGLECIFR
jgi:hypothetical protein